MNKLFATIIFRIPFQVYKGNNFILGELAENLDAETILIHEVAFKNERDGIKITVEVETQYSDSHECQNEDEAEAILQGKLDNAIKFDANQTILIDADNTQFTS